VKKLFTALPLSYCGVFIPQMGIEPMSVLGEKELLRAFAVIGERDV
jgi:hypothetical protein